MDEWKILLQKLNIINNIIINSTKLQSLLDVVMYTQYNNIEYRVLLDDGGLHVHTQYTHPDYNSFTVLFDETDIDIWKSKIDKHLYISDISKIKNIYFIDTFDINSSGQFASEDLSTFSLNPEKEFFRELSYSTETNNMIDFYIQYKEYFENISLITILDKKTKLSDLINISELLIEEFINVG